MKSTDEWKPTSDPNRKTTVTQHERLYAHAVAAFGTLTYANEWLARPCSRLENRIPSEIIKDQLGLQVVNDYLERIELGVYQ